MSDLDIVKLTDSIFDAVKPNKVSVIGIDGLGGAGKSTVSQKLKECIESQGYSVALLHADDFIFQRSIRYNDAYPQWQCYYDLQWRYNYLKGIISQFKDREQDAVLAELYDKETDCYVSCGFTVSDKTMVILEGIFLQREELADVFDFMIYVDVPKEERLRRVLSRDKYIGGEEDILQKYNERYFPAERYYVQKCSPKENADMVI